MNDGTTRILSNLRVQLTSACAYFALVTTLESNLRVQLQRSATLSIRQLMNQYDEAKISLSLPEETKMVTLLQMIKDHGIFEKGQYTAIQKGTLREADARRYKIAKWYAYSLNELEHIRHAMYQLRKGGPLVAVINISENYRECKDSGFIYRYDPNNPVKKNSGVIETHAVSVVSFAVEAKVPCLECQDSRGPEFGRGGFLVVDITSVVELYSIKMNMSSS